MQRREIAASPKTEVWLSDEDEHPVQMEAGALRTGLLEGDYFVEFDLGTTSYPVSLYEETVPTESEITSGPSCPRPKIRLPDEQFAHRALVSSLLPLFG